MSALRYTEANGRREALLSIVREQGFCPAGELSAQLGVSRVTVRRDILQLEAQGLVRAARGGVSAVTDTVTGGGHFEFRRQEHRAAKRAIARRAAELLTRHDGTVIGIDAGTTAAELAGYVASMRGVTVVTHSLPAMAALSRNREIELVALGGVFHADTQAFAGPTTIANLQRVRLGVAFLTASAIRGGVMYCGNEFDAETKRTMLDLADRVILLADSSKFSKAAAFTVAPIDVADVLVVDDGVTEADERTLTGVEVEIVKVPVAATSTRAAT